MPDEKQNARALPATDHSMQTITATVAALGGEIARHAGVPKVCEAYCSAVFPTSLDSGAPGWRIAEIFWRESVNNVQMYGDLGHIAISAEERRLDFTDTRNNLLWVFAPDKNGQIRAEYGLSLEPGNNFPARSWDIMSLPPDASHEQVAKQVRLKWTLGEQDFKQTFAPILALARAAREPAFPWVYAPELVEMLELCARPAEVFSHGPEGLTANTPALSRRSLADDSKALP